MGEHANFVFETSGNSRLGRMVSVRGGISFGFGFGFHKISNAPAQPRGWDENADQKLPDPAPGSITESRRPPHERTLITMKTRTLLAALTLPLVTALPAAAQETERLKDRAADAAESVKATAEKAADVVAEKSRAAWAKTKALFSDDPETYRKGADQKLAELREEIAALRARTAGVASRAYFKTRLMALDEQHQYAAKQLATLPPDEVKKGREGSRKDVDVTLERLEEHLDIAQREARDFTPPR